MKKVIFKKKLTLNKETLRTLEQPELDAVAGGLTLGTCRNSCPGTTCGTHFC